MNPKLLVIGAALILLGSACGGSSGVSATELAPVVQRDGVPFAGSDIPDKMLLRLAEYPVVVIGETHLIREQREFTAALVEELHAHGFRQLLLEWPHMADWVMADYVVDGDLAPDWWNPPNWLYGDLLADIREFNRGLPAEERIAVRGIDVNLDNYGGAKDFRDSLRGLSDPLPDRGPIDEFLQSGYDTADTQTAALETLQAALRSDRETLVEAWGQERYEMVSEMTEIELGSIPVRATWDDDPNQSAQLREQLMKDLADARLLDYEHGSVVNVGGNYLVHTSTAPRGPVISIVVVPARVVAEYQTQVPDWDLMATSPDNELFRLMSERWPGQSVFLPFTDPVFSDGDVAMTSRTRSTWHHRSVTTTAPSCCP